MSHNKPLENKIPKCSIKVQESTEQWIIAKITCPFKQIIIYFSNPCALWAHKFHSYLRCCVVSHPLCWCEWTKKAESDVVQMRHNLWVCGKKKRWMKLSFVRIAERCVRCGGKWKWGRSGVEMHLRGSDDTRELDVNKLRPVNISRPARNLWRGQFLIGSRRFSPLWRSFLCARQSLAGATQSIIARPVIKGDASRVKVCNYLYLRARAADDCFFRVCELHCDRPA